MISRRTVIKIDDNTFEGIKGNMISRRTVIKIDDNTFEGIKAAEKIFDTLMGDLEEIDDSDCATMAELARGAWAYICDFLDYYKTYTQGD